jgi:predicted TIM-barrel fold metal-dependent hydrolase
MLPFQDVDLAIAEAHRAAAMGTVSYFIRPNPIRGLNLNNKYYWPLFGEIEKLDLPISIHDSGSPQLPSFGDRMDTHTSGHILSHPFEAMYAMTCLIWGGIFERFPRLTAVHLEADAGWVPYWLQRMEQHWDFSGNAEHPDMKMRPTEYFQRNVFVACRSDEPTLKAAIELVGDNNFVWNSDYPHPDGTWPWALRKMEEQPIPEASKRKILWDNAARAFRLN